MKNLIFNKEVILEKHFEEYEVGVSLESISIYDKELNQEYNLENITEMDNFSELIILLKEIILKEKAIKIQISHEKHQKSSKPLFTSRKKISREFRKDDLDFHYNKLDSVLYDSIIPVLNYGDHKVKIRLADFNYDSLLELCYSFSYDDFELFQVR